MNWFIQNSGSNIFLHPGDTVAPERITLHGLQLER